ncbi:MAG: HK97 gp10 family phage protein [Sphaerochaeta sp.]|jgi:HK97 gp10 family phage protein|nr:HK97 gp10 family phage protein [Sphaerochaeta sp.]
MIFNLTGAAKTMAAFKAIAEASEKGVVDALEKGGMMVRDQAEQNAPMRTGGLKGSAYSTDAEEEKGILEVYAGFTEDYARFPEFGTKQHGKAQHFLDDAFNGLKGTIKAMVIKSVLLK